MEERGTQGAERRRNPQLRVVFDHAYPILEPFFDPSSGWDAHTRQHVAAGLLQDNFPELSSPDVHLIIVAAGRVFRERNPHLELMMVADRRAMHREH
jgi:hypothetical protein